MIIRTQMCRHEHEDLCRHICVRIINKERPVLLNYKTVIHMRTDAPLLGGRTACIADLIRKSVNLPEERLHWILFRSHIHSINNFEEIVIVHIADQSQFMLCSRRPRIKQKSRFCFIRRIAVVLRPKIGSDVNENDRIRFKPFELSAGMERNVCSLPFFNA